MMRGDEEWGTIPGLIRAAARRYGDREAVVEGRTRVSYAELGDRVERAAAACMASGVEPGDRVAVWAPNTLDWIVSALGAVTAGAVLVPLNTRFKGTEAAYILQRSRAKLLFVTGTFLGTSYVASLRRADVRLPHLERVVVLADAAPDDYLTWKDFLAAGEGVSGAEVRSRADAIASSAPSDIIYTSGTTEQAQGRGHHPRPDPALLRDLERTGGSARGRPLSDREPLLPHLRLQGRHHRVPDAGRDDGPAAGLQRGHGPGQHRRRTHLGAARPAHPPPVPPGPPRTLHPRPLRPPPGGDGRGGGPAETGGTPAHGAGYRHGPHRVRPLRGERHRHDVAGAATRRRRSPRRPAGRSRTPRSASWPTPAPPARSWSAAST